MRKSALLLVFLALVTPVWASDVVETIVARINAEIITLSELAHQRDVLKQDLSQRGMNGMQLQAEFQSREKDLLRDLIDNSLLLQKGKEEGINVEAELVKQLNATRIRMNFKDME